MRIDQLRRLRSIGAGYIDAVEAGQRADQYGEFIKAELAKINAQREHRLRKPLITMVEQGPEEGWKFWWRP